MAISLSLGSTVVLEKIQFNFQDFFFVFYFNFLSFYMFFWDWKREEFNNFKSAVGSKESVSFVCTLASTEATNLLLKLTSAFASCALLNSASGFL